MGFFKDLWHNQPNTVISAGVAILVLLGICIWLLNFISIKNFISHKNFEGSWSYLRKTEGRWVYYSLNKESLFLIKEWITSLTDYSPNRKRCCE